MFVKCFTYWIRYFAPALDQGFASRYSLRNSGNRRLKDERGREEDKMALLANKK
jgi:hypothetical protein